MESREEINGMDRITCLLTYYSFPPLITSPLGNVCPQIPGEQIIYITERSFMSNNIISILVNYDISLIAQKEISRVEEG